MTAPAPVWLLTVNWDYQDQDGEPDTSGQAMRTHQSLHSDQDGAKLRLFDTIYAVTKCTPADTSVIAGSQREDSALFADLDADGEYITYSLIPMPIETRKGA